MCVRARERERGKAAGCTLLAPHLQLDIEAAGEERTFVVVQIKVWDAGIVWTWLVEHWVKFMGKCSQTLSDAFTLPLARWAKNTV